MTITLPARYPAVPAGTPARSCTGPRSAQRITARHLAKEGDAVMLDGDQATPSTSAAPSPTCWPTLIGVPRCPRPQPSTVGPTPLGAW